MLLPGLSLYLPVLYVLLASSAALPGDFGVLPCYTCGCAHTACWALRFLDFLPVLRPPSGSSSPCSGGSSSPLGLPTFAMGSPLQGRDSFVLDRNEGLVSPFGSVSWLGLEPLSEASLCTLFLWVGFQVVLAVDVSFGCT